MAPRISLGQDVTGAESINDNHPKLNGEVCPKSPEERKRVVVVGLGMVGIVFIEKLMKLDAKCREYNIIVIGEESHLACNRVGLTSFFQHRQAENLYLNPEEWYTSMPEGSLSYHLNTLATLIDPGSKTVTTAKGDRISYDILVLATGSNAVIPYHTSGHDAKGVFVYRTIDDLQKLIAFARTVKGTTGAIIGGGLLGLEAAKAMMDLKEFSKARLIERNRWVLSRQLDEDAGSMVVELVQKLGLDVMLNKRARKIEVDGMDCVKGVVFEDGGRMDCGCLMFAIGITARDDLARQAGIKCANRGGGIVVGPDLSTTIPDIYAIGECASWENQTFGLIAPEIDMADVLSFNLTQSKVHSPRKFKRPDLSTKLKLLGVDVASFGDFFADRDGLQGEGRIKLKGKITQNGATNGTSVPRVKTLSYKDPFQAVYKKYLFTMDEKYLLGGMMIGDTRDYVKLVPMVKNRKPLEVPPSEFILGANKDGEDNMTSQTTHKSVLATIVGDLKSCTKAGTGCGGCIPLVQTIFNKEMQAMGAEVLNHLCPHFSYSRADLYNIIFAKKLRSLPEVMKEAGKYPNSLGCEVCKPAIASIFASLFNQHVMDASLHGLQDTNDKFLANIQRNGTFSVIPRVAGGEITPEKLIVIGTVAKKYGLYCKITGGQRIDMFGAKKSDLVDIWTKLVSAGMESGHACAKSLRTVKSCVGTTWCRFDIGDSVGMAIRLEERYKSIRPPHKIKGGVSGCVRECAEAQNKDFGLIATEKGFNIFVGGNGGATPRHSELLAKDIPPDDVVPILDRYLMFYIRTVDKLQRIACWVENLPGGIEYLRKVVLEDCLDICAELEKQMTERKAFQQFGNTEERVESTEVVREHGQSRPTNWLKDGITEDFREHMWKSDLTWQPIIEADKFNNTSPTGSSQNVKRGDTQLAIFKIKGRYYATQQMCPHKRAFVLSDGLVGDDMETGKFWVSCPYHKRNYTLNGTEAGKCSNDESMNIATFPAEERDDGMVYLKLPSVEELDSVLGTEKWKVRAGETKSRFEKYDGKYKRVKGRKAFGGSHLNDGIGEEEAARRILARQGSDGIEW
ncbi:MAG: hypothetical protein M1834_007354 [Cirrosporium novae-zelandiae]|nr:MAG: hypothetical protein M1834_007354 [Cirrosporium novae-zelandiae]